MTKQLDPERLDLLILLRLAASLKHPRPSALRRPLERWVVPPVSATGWPSLFEARVAALRDRGWVEDLRLTEAGVAHLKATLGLSRVDWRSVRPTVAALALGLDRDLPDPVAAESTPTDDLAAFALGALQVARAVPASGRWGTRRVFLSAVYDAAFQRQQHAGLDRDAFKERLCAAHRSGHVVLHRADLVRSMDPTLVRDSEVRYLHAAFHLLDVEAPP